MLADFNLAECLKTFTNIDTTEDLLLLATAKCKKVYIYYVSGVFVVPACTNKGTCGHSYSLYTFTSDVVYREL